MLTWWATTSCSSRAIRTRSANTAWRAFASRLRSAPRARSSGDAAGGERPRGAQRALFGRRGERRALAQPEARQPRDGEQAGRDQELPGRMVRVVVGDD